MDGAGERVYATGMPAKRVAPELHRKALSVRVAPDTLEALQRLAKQRKLTVSSLVHQMLCESLQAKGALRPAKSDLVK